MSKSEKQAVKKVKLTAITAEVDSEIDFLEPDEWYLGELEEIESDTGVYGPYLRWTFRILNGTLENGNTAKGKKATRLMNTKLNPSSVLWSWTKVLLKKDPEVGESYDFTSFYGDKFRVLIKDKKPKKGEEVSKRFQVVDAIKRRIKKAEDE